MIKCYYFHDKMAAMTSSLNPSCSNLHVKQYTFIVLYFVRFVKISRIVQLNGSAHTHKASDRFFDKMAAMTSSFGRIFQNSNAHPQAYGRLFLESFVKIGPVVFAKRCVTDRQTDRHTHIHTDTPGILPRHDHNTFCLLYTSPSPRDRLLSRMPSSA